MRVLFNRFFTIMKQIFFIVNWQSEMKEKTTRVDPINMVMKQLNKDALIFYYTVYLYAMDRTHRAIYPVSSMTKWRNRKSVREGKPEKEDHEKEQKLKTINTRQIESFVRWYDDFLSILSLFYLSYLFYW
jgi:hypothetical protein